MAVFTMKQQNWESCKNIWITGVSQPIYCLTLCRKNCWSFVWVCVCALCACASCSIVSDSFVNPHILACTAHLSMGFWSLAYIVQAPTPGAEVASILSKLLCFHSTGRVDIEEKTILTVCRSIRILLFWCLHWQTIQQVHFLLPFLTTTGLCFFFFGGVSEGFFFL